jgi:hypothetical protein
MIPFTGTSNIHHYVKGKLHPLGIKIFVLATPDDLVHDFEIYQGVTTKLRDVNLCLGAKVVLPLAETLTPFTSLYFDRYFTNLKLIHELNNRQLFVNATQLHNKSENSPLSEAKDIKKHVSTLSIVQL